MHRPYRPYHSLSVFRHRLSRYIHWNIQGALKKTESCNQNMKLSAVWTRGPFFVRLDGSTVITWLRHHGGCEPDCYRTYIKYYCSECRLRRDETETEGKRSSYCITAGCTLGICLAREHVQFFKILYCNDRHVYTMRCVYVSLNIERWKVISQPTASWASCCYVVRDAHSVLQVWSGVNWSSQTCCRD